MNRLTHHIGTSWLMVLDSGKPSQTIFVHVDPKRVTGSHHNVDTKVEFEPIYYERL